MASSKKPTHVITHPSLYLRVNGKLQEMVVGTPIALSAKVAKGMVKRKFVKSLKDVEAVDVGNDE